MYLKRLELIGFKSFAEKTVLEFGPGITAVVGPNGSGKSNIADALRWVLGEPSIRELRGSRVEDVIFAGAEKRRPLGFAEVSLTLDNSDGGLPVAFTEVVVTRRVDRGGEVEYLLNGSPCRLKDVHDLFLDTGLGRDSYSVIGQGRIDQVLSARPEDRRGVFEEAAGIARYRVRRREAARRLAETEQNLLRLGDLIQEVSARLADLAVQAETARRHQGLTAEVDRLERGLLALALVRTERALEGQRAREASAAGRMGEAERELEKAEAALGTARALAAALQEEGAALQATLADLAARLEQARGRARLAEQEARRAAEEAVRLESEIATSATRLREVEEEAGATAARAAQVAAERAEAEARLAGAEARLGDLRQAQEEARDQAESERARAFAAAEAAAERRNRAQAEERAGAEADRRLAQLGERQRALEKEERAARERTREVAARLEHLAGRRAELSRCLEAAGAASRQAEAEAKAHAAKLERLRARQGAVASRLALLEELRAGFEGFGRGTRTVLRGREEGKPWARGVVGAVAELVRADAAYERALEVALGGAVNDVVVESERVARACIEELKRSGGGRATFLPLDLVRPSGLSAAERAQLAAVPGFVGVAADLCRFDERVAPAIRHLLGRVAVARDLEAAIAMGRRTDLRLRIVTLDGELVSPGGAITGGAETGRGGGLLARERERAELAAERQALEQAIRQASAALEEARRRAGEAAREGAEAGEALRRVEVEAAALQAEAARWAAEADRLGRERDALAREAAALQAERSGGEEVRERLLREAEALEAEQAAAAAALEAALARAEALGREAEAAGRDVTALRVRLAELAQEERALAAQEDRVARERGRLRQELEDRQERLAAARRREEQARADLAIAREEEQARAAEREEAAGRKAALDRRLLEVQGQIAGLERQARQLRRTTQELQSLVAGARAEAARLEGELEGLRARAREQFGADPARLTAEALAPEEAQEARQRLAELREAILALGPVNLAAVEEHRQATERHAFLTAQARDLEEARESLYRAIDELDRRIESQFRSAFERIRREFRDVYRGLFEGGQADLVLLDESNLLETGVEIVVQPPGKKETPLAALSGGERALTAAALLFALLRVRPSPFVVLDEVDAALDEANVARFGRYLSELSKTTQVICITHQRGTMAVADALYGVTMEGNGVSRVVSVRLQDADRRLAG
ncbi:chromosome segregation protein SMC [Caldinitratiruptor microaerophilus]|uniref:Chromosome partition protein Smc n=1 Tax=Caldinitratiruptor microaerophilus TaxID=671077 RepID=A0AA35CK54_9FIRM|nr:chromosome segregation protein SMC [Caldinitratiruptor microaerophilus]BDG60607.1 hypothetical protein caldi_16970 [Caldinitratiruptor microaerophilus]